MQYDINMVENYFHQLFETPNHRNLANQKTLTSSYATLSLQLRKYQNIPRSPKDVFLDGPRSGPNKVVLRTACHAKCAPTNLAITKVMLA